ncbi:brevican core protein [Mixophyes fleayi]|uniref:brevican core protein n=1 Tax=Mixophyes fleayi TaxID=3061075 RepID=UPI003F4E0932
MDMKLNLLLVLAVALTSQALTSDVEENSRENKSLSVRIGNSTTKTVLSGTLTIPCHITYQSPTEDVSVGRRAVLATPRVKWTFISNGKEVEILVARGHKVKMSEGYRLRASLPHYSSSAYDVTLVLRELLSNDSGIYRCHVQHGIEDNYDMLEVKVKGVVFLYREGTNRYAYTFPMAQESCARIKAHIATADQLLAAYRGGYEQCDAGWIADQTVRYPIQTPREGCYGDMDGFPGVRNYGVLEPDDLYDVYCYVEELNGEVFLGSTPNKFTLEEAREYCRRTGSDIATTGQIYAAWNEGLDHCSPGWLSDGSVRYPIVTPREKCGGNLPGVKTIFQFRNQTGFPDSQAKYDVYCFRGKSPASTQDLDESLPAPGNRVRDVITVTESFEELKLPEVKAENEAQGSVDSIPLNKTDVTKPKGADTETITLKDQQESPPYPTTPTVESIISGEDLSPALASFPPYEDNTDDCEECTTTDTIATPVLESSQEDNLGLVPEKTPKSTGRPFEEHVLPTDGDTILDLTFVNVNAENYYDNFTDMAQELGATVSESGGPFDSDGTPEPTQFSESDHTVDANHQKGTSQGDTHNMTKADTSSIHVVPTMISSILEAGVDYRDINKSLAEENDKQLVNTSLETPIAHIVSSISPTTEQNNFEASGNEDHSMLTEQYPKTIVNSLEEMVSGDHTSGTPDDITNAPILDSNLVLTTAMATSPEPKSNNIPKLSWEDGSGEVPEFTSSDGSTADGNSTQTHETNRTENREGPNHSTYTPLLAVQNLYEPDETSTAQVSHLKSPDVSSVISTVKDIGVEQPYVREKIHFPTSVVGTVQSLEDLDSNTAVTPVHTTSTSPPNNPRNSTTQPLEKTFRPTVSMSPTYPLPAVPTEKAIVGSSVNFSDDCYPNPCENGGTCTEEDDGDFRCLCLPGYFGKACEINVDKCLDDWDTFQGFCYKHFYTRRSWVEAETHCRGYGSHLVSIVAPEEQDFVNNKYREYQWTGLNDRTIEGDFQWSDGNPLLFENWNHGQPDSYFLSGEDCVVMGWHDGGQWSDVPCNYHLPYTCKMGLVFCGAPPEVTNASTYGRPKTRYQISSVVGYRCDEGFVQRNSPIIKCQSDGVWEEPQINCWPTLL